MSNCRNYDDSIWEAAETGVVSPDLRDHIRTCKQCARSLNELANAISGFESLRHVDSPDPIPAIYAQLDSQRRKRWAALAVAGALAACALIAILSIVRSPAPPASLARLHQSAPVHVNARIPARPPSTQIAIIPTQPTRAPEARKPVSTGKTRRLASPERHVRRIIRYAAKRHEAATETKQVESDIERPCDQFTAIVPRLREPIRPPERTADPTYCAVVIPDVQPVPEPQSSIM